MARAEIILPTGAKVVIEGTEDEVRALLEVYRPSRGVARAGRSRGTSVKTVAGRSVKGPKMYIRQLREEEFFTAKRTLKDVQAKLGERGHIYPQNILAAALIRLTKDGLLGRMKEGKVWVYVQR